jgi:hypothetical protein
MQLTKSGHDGKRVQPRILCQCIWNNIKRVSKHSHAVANFSANLSGALRQSHRELNIRRSTPGSKNCSEKIDRTTHSAS